MINRKKKEAAAQAAAAAEAAAQTEAAEDSADAAENAVSDSDAPAADAPAQPARDEKDERIELLEADLAELKDQHLRALAEYDNFRKRTAREKQSLSADVKADCVTALLPIIDNLERALSSGNADAGTLRKGVEMVLNQACTIFGGLGVTSFGEPGDTFDPQLHECVSTVEANDDFAADQITLVIQKGYMLGDKVIRHAMVQVAN